MGVAGMLARVGGGGAAGVGGAVGGVTVPPLLVPSATTTTVGPRTLPTVFAAPVLATDPDAVTVAARRTTLPLVVTPTGGAHTFT
jgi:hypothetical protein